MQSRALLLLRVCAEHGLCLYVVAFGWRSNFPLLSDCDAMVGVSIRDASGALKAVGQTERVGGLQTVVFGTKLAFQHVPDQDEQYRFALYDLDEDERVTDDELVGEAWVSSRLLLAGGTLELPLKKGGRSVMDTVIVVNPAGAPTVGTSSKKAAVELSTTTVSVACTGFPMLSTNDAVVCAALRDQRTSRYTLVSQTELLK